MNVELFKDFSRIYGDNFTIYFVWTINMVCDINAFLALNQPSIIPGINLTWTWYVTFLMWFWILIF